VLIVITVLNVHKLRGLTPCGHHKQTNELKGSTKAYIRRPLTDLGGKPLLVLTADKGNHDDKWRSKQDHLATSSTNSLHRHINATHASLLDNEADPAAASQAIHDVVALVRTSQPLGPR
jgi:hypothetical protein